MCLRKTQVRKSHDYRDVIVFEKLRCPEELVRTVDLTVKIKLQEKKTLI